MGPSGGFPKDSAGARVEGLEPSITGPEPVVLPITPPPNGWSFRLAEVVGVVIAALGAPRLGIVEAVEGVEAGHPAQTDPPRPLQEVGPRRPALYRRCLRGGGRGNEAEGGRNGH